MKKKKKRTKCLPCLPVLTSLLFIIIIVQIVHKYFLSDFVVLAYSKISFFSGVHFQISPPPSGFSLPSKLLEKTIHSPFHLPLLPALLIFHLVELFLIYLLSIIYPCSPFEKNLSYVFYCLLPFLLVYLRSAVFSSTCVRADPPSQVILLLLLGGGF